jgi:hypothetical protein
MQMAFMEEGGLTDDGTTMDPVSGNEVPPGSMAEEVRDDIPAQLSEGEYVVPADVVRFYGVKFFEDLRMEAKRGLMDRYRVWLWAVWFNLHKALTLICNNNRCTRTQRL